eukprot:ANDGO_05013.mRNA.1 26S proteasome non-ATPase regulatory subunit 11 homolog
MMTVDNLAEKLERAVEIADSKPAAAAQSLYEIINSSNTDAQSIKCKEDAITRLAKLYSSIQDAQGLRNLLVAVRPFFLVVPKAKTAKMVRMIIDMLGKIPGTGALQMELCRDSIDWCRAEKRTFLRQRIESRLAALYFESKDYNSALQLVNSLVREVRKLDDKALLVEIQLLESRIHHSLRNVPKARAALTAARTAANAIYCPPLLQAQIDLQAGVLCAEEKDYKTAYSYFLEAFETYHASTEQILVDSEMSTRQAATLCLKYMLLCKIMTDNASDVSAILSGKNAIEYTGRNIAAMKAVAEAHLQRSLEGFHKALRDYDAELHADLIVHAHLSSLYDKFLAQNIIKFLEPYSQVQISYISYLLGMEAAVVERKISQMILDKVLLGVIDQSTGCFIAYAEDKGDKTFGSIVETMDHMGKVVDVLFERSQKLL